MTSEDLLANNVALSGGLGGELRRTQQSLKIALLTIDKLKLELAYLRRMKYGRSSEQLEHAQLELVGGMVAAPAAEPPSNVTAIEAGRKKRATKARPGLREFPEHLPRRKALPGKFSGLHLLAIMYTAFQQIDPTMDTGADFSAEYQAALEMQQK